MTLFLVRHGRPLIVRSRPAREWRLDPAYDDDVRALRGRLPPRAAWFSSPEPTAFMTARLLTEEPIEVVGDLREHQRESTDWQADFESVVRRSFREPDVLAHEGWETVADCRARVVGAVAGILMAHPGRDLVLVGHGTAWTLVRAALTGAPPDLEWWSRLAMPDVVQCPVAGDPGDMLGA